MTELVVAFDTPNGRDALTLADRLPGLAWAKIGPVLFVREGPALVREFTARRVRVFLDLKWHDIPNTVVEAVTAARELGVSMATVHALGGDVMLQAAARAAGDVALVAVTVLTSHDSGSFGRIVGRPRPDLQAEAIRLGRSALEAGCRGVVASGQELEGLRAVLGPAAYIVVPGIRPPGAGADDQSRTTTPADAVRLGASHIVVGRPILQAPDPAAAYRRIAGDL